MTTIEIIAKKAGVSRGTVDRVLHDRGQVKPETAERVRAVMEEMDFQPMFDACKNMLSGKRVALFGSFGWGDGQWMRDWESDCSNAGISLTCESVTCCETPDDTALAACREMGKALAG